MPRVRVDHVPGFPPGAFWNARLPQKAPGGSRGTPGRMHSRVPCCAGLNRDIACRHPAWTAGWFAHPVSPGFHPGLFVQVPGPEGRVDSSGRRPAKRTAARCRGFACSMLPGFHPGLFVQVPGPEGRVDESGRRPAEPLRAPSEDASRAEWESLRVKQSVFPHLTVRASQQPGTTAKDRGERGRKPQPDSTAGDCRSSGASLPTDQVFAGFVAAT